MIYRPAKIPLGKELEATVTAACPLLFGPTLGDMAEFLTTNGTSYRLEEIIKSSTERLVLISPFIRVNERIKELLEDKDRLKIDVRVIYGKNELQPEKTTNSNR